MKNKEFSQNSFCVLIGLAHFIVFEIIDASTFHMISRTVEHMPVDWSPTSCGFHRVLKESEVV